MKLNRTDLHRLANERAFFWAAGIEDTFVTSVHPVTGRHLDEYELTGHYERWRDDLRLFRELGLEVVRYGVPWHRIQPAPGDWKWEFVDQTLEFLLDQGITPIVDLVHYGLPPWIEGAYANPDFPALMEEYTARMVERFRGRIFSWTPLNEPRITGWYCGRIGWWPPHFKSWRGFVALMLQIARGIVRSVRVIEQAHPENVAYHVDATDLYEAGERSLADDARLRQEIVFLALDLVSGRVHKGHLLHSWLLQHGASAAELQWFEEHAVAPEVIGINLYPMFSSKLLVRRSGSLRIRMSYATAGIVERLAEMYYQRFRCPLFIAETASVGSVRRRSAWLRDSVAATGRARAKGIPLIGYTWWPLFALVTWGYRQGKHPPAYYLKQMGLWDLSEDDRLERIPTSLVQEYQALVAGGGEAVSTPKKGKPCSEASSLPDSNVRPVTTR